MITDNEIKLLKHLRNNSRKPLAKISEETSIPTSTLFDTLKKLESNIIVKHVTLIDYVKLGYSLKANFVISVNDRDGLKDFLNSCPNVNTLSSLVNGHFYAECIFKDMKEMSDFREKLNSFEPTNIEENFVIEEVKKEGFEV